MKFLRRIPLALAVLALAATASAAPINGSMSLTGAGVDLNGAANLSLATLIEIALLQTDLVTPGTGDYSIVPTATIFDSGIQIDFNNIATGGGFTFSNLTYGSFAANFGSVQQATPSFLDVYLEGTYSGLPGPNPSGDTSVRVSFTQSGPSVSASLTLNSPPRPPNHVPEPGTMAMLGSGLLGAAIVARRKLRKA